MEQHAAELDALVAGAHSILLTGPVDPDGDSVGACLGLARLIRARHGKARVAVAGDPGARYAGLPDAAGMLPDADIAPDWDVVIVMDGDKSRLTSEVDAAFKAAKKRVIVDHHGTTTSEGYDLAILSPQTESTCGMVMEILDAWKGTLDQGLAKLLYAGVIFDTGGFRYSNTKPSTHRMAARLLETGIEHDRIAVTVLMERRAQGLKLAARVQSAMELHHDGRVSCGVISQALLQELDANSTDVEGIVESLLYLQGVQVSALLSERSPGVTKLSFRSRGQVDVAQLARSLTTRGGGHPRAAGATLMMDLDQGKAKVLAALGEKLKG